MKSLSNDQDRKELLERLARLQIDSRAQWGKMSAHQMICHLSDSFKAGTGEKYASPAETLLSRTVMKWAALRLPVTWPKGVKTRPEMAQEGGGTKPAEFEADRQELERVLAQFTASPRDYEWQRHPLFGEMSQSEWYRWGYLHMDHHLRQFGL